MKEFLFVLLIGVGAYATITVRGLNSEIETLQQAKASEKSTLDSITGDLDKSSQQISELQASNAELKRKVEEGDAALKAANATIASLRAAPPVSAPAPPVMLTEASLPDAIATPSNRAAESVLPNAIATTPAPAPLSPAAQDDMRQQIKELQEDIRMKLGEMASVYARDGYAKAANSQSSFRDTVVEESDKVAELEKQLGMPETPEVRWLPYYPYYAYAFLPY